MRIAIAATLMSAGIAFIFIGGIGVARLPDAFQRMHASTKAGGIGTTLVIIGVLVGQQVDRPMTAVLTIICMLLTLSVASQLLARAAYVAGAAVEQLEGRDALEGILERAQETPPENGVQQTS